MNQRLSAVLKACGEQSPEGYVYFIREGSDGPVKIGWTFADPSMRLKTLQTGNSKPLVLLQYIPGTVKTERSIQRLFDDQWILGEWFSASPELLDYIRNIRDDDELIAQITD
jgi:hypothetical protein